VSAKPQTALEAAFDLKRIDFEPIPHAEPRAQSLLNLQFAVHQPPAEPEAAPTTPIPPIQELDRDTLRHFEVMRRDCPETLLNSFRQLRGRLLRRSVELTGFDRALRTVFVTSPEPRAGKTFIARNLALMTGVIPDCQVLLADVHQHRPALTRLLGLEGRPGIHESFAGHPWQDVVRRVPGLDVFIAGAGLATPDALDPFDARLLDRFRHRIGSDFDWLILDGPSLSESADAEMLSHLADLTVLVLPPGALTTHALSRRLSGLNPSKLAGFVFNRLP
jgi:Mrp family chromosome partitioning ATPase